MPASSPFPSIIRVRVLYTAFATFMIVLGAQGTAVAETRGYVVSWFYMASYSQDGDCAQGLNPSVEQNLRRILADQGKTPDEIEKAVAAGTNAMLGVFMTRGRIDGKPVNPYFYPTSVPDPHIKTLTGKYAFGFDLDGKDGPDDFVDPETGEHGVDNQLYRAVGCFVPSRAFPPDRPGYAATLWDMPRDAAPAWLVEVSGTDLSKDGEVTVGIYRATAPVTRDSTGGPISDMTFRVDDDSRTNNIVSGHIKNGVVTTDSFDFHMMYNVFFQPLIHLGDARLRMSLKSNGTARGVIGGYQDWLPLYWSYALGGVFNETQVSFDVPGIYYALKHMADAYPAPGTGENTAISAAYTVEAVPAFIVHPVGSAQKTAAVSPVSPAELAP